MKNEQKVGTSICMKLILETPSNASPSMDSSPKDEQVVEEHDPPRDTPSHISIIETSSISTEEVQSTVTPNLKRKSELEDKGKLKKSRIEQLEQCKVHVKECSEKVRISLI